MSAATHRPADFDALVMKWTPLLHKLAFKFEPRAEEREDLVQETIATALHRWESYDPHAKISGWLAFQMREVRNRRYRSRGLDSVALTDEMEQTIPVAETQSGVAAAADIVRAVEGLGRDRDVMMAIISDERQHEIARRMGVSREAVRQKVARARAALAPRIGYKEAA